MAFAEDLSLFLSDFGASITAGAVSGLAIFDMPGENVIDGMSISTSYRLTCRADEFGWLAYGDVVDVESEAYQVQEQKPIGDGKFCEVLMEKTVGSGPVVFVLDGDLE